VICKEGKDEAFSPLVVLLLLAMVSCVSSGVETTVHTGGPTVNQALTYHGPKARIAVASFRCKAAKCHGEIGEGLADMLATALFQTGRFIVLERGEGLRAIQEELNLGQSGYVRQDKAPQVGQMEGADILVMGAVTAFEPNASGTVIGGGVVPFKVPLLGGVRFKKKEAYIALDLRLVDVRTGRVINATTVEGKASSWKAGGLLGGAIGEIALGGWLNTYRNTPMEKAIRVMLANAVNAIAQMVPENYYRWGEETSGYHRPPVSSSLAQNGSAAGGGLKRPSMTFRPGKRIIWTEDFTECEEIPSGVELEGAAECVEFSDQKWLAVLNNTVRLAKGLPRRFSWSKDWAVEFSFYATRASRSFVRLEPGSPRSSLTLLIMESDQGRKTFLKLGENSLYLKTPFANKIHHVALQKKGDRLRVFLDGHRVLTAHLEKGAWRGSERKIWIEFGGERVNIDENRYVLVSDIRVSLY
jgi:curli biogenesis system outer membrane secretion channel CsgG